MTTRRDFLKTAAYAGAAVAATGFPAPSKAFFRRETKLRELSIGVVGTIGETDRKTVASHPDVEIVGLCDVDAEAMEKASKDQPKAFKCEDYREAFDKHGDKFDACIISTPDHSHCSIMTAALSRNKHVYGQKPLVHQLEELDIMDRAIKARPKLVTQVGAQRIEYPHRRAAIHIMRTGGLGKVVEAHVTFGNGALAGGFYFHDGSLGDPCDPPKGFNYDLWLAGSQPTPCRPNLVKRQWRSWFNFGGGQIADWVVHTTDVLFYSYPELMSPVSVLTRTPTKEMPFFHADRVSSTLTYNVTGDKFAGPTFNLHFYDTGLQPDRKQLGLGEGEYPSGVNTIVVCEGGTIVLPPEGSVEVWRGGKKEDGMKWPGLPELPKFNHWHAWVESCLGRPSPNHWMPFPIGLRCTEPGLLAVKAAKFRGQTLHWDRQSLTFPNHAEATKTLVRRDYRKGFEPVRL